MTSPVVDEAIKKAAIAWIAVGDGPSLGLWCMPLDGALIVVSGPGEQSAPGLGEASRAGVRLRGDTGGLIVIWDAVVERLQPGSEDWDTIAPQLANKRLNASGTAEELVTRWAESGCAVVRLTPAREAGGSGLGLAIARWIAEVHGGTLRVAASGPQGTTFTARLLHGQDPLG